MDRKLQVIQDVHAIAIARYNGLIVDEEMTVKDLQEMMDEHEKFILEQIRNMRKEKK